jgi:hypothetical protein
VTVAEVQAKAAPATPDTEAGADPEPAPESAPARN